MSIFAKFGLGVAKRVAAGTVTDIARRVVRESKLKRKARREGYLQGYADAKAGKRNRHVR